MNFDFLEHCEGFEPAMIGCASAERTALKKPLDSIRDSCMSAELFAKFLYLAAHCQKMKSLSLSDLISDPAVCKFVENQEVMESFHRINDVAENIARSDTELIEEKAVTVLENLHNIVGETSVKLGLIDDYCLFNKEDIEASSEMEYEDDRDLNHDALRMFMECIGNIDKLDVPSELDCYYKNRVDGLCEELGDIYSRFAISSNCTGHIDLSEIIEFKQKPKDKKSIKPIQAHFALLGMSALTQLRAEVEGEWLTNWDENFSCELTLYGENGYTTSNVVEFIEGVMYDLPNADGFKIYTKYYGPHAGLNYGCENGKHFFGLESVAEDLGKTESFTYKVNIFRYNCGEGRVVKYEDGKRVCVESLFSPEIVDKDFGHDWFGWSVDMGIKFDFNKYPNIVEALHNAVRKHIPENQLELCECSWNDEEEPEPGFLINCISWCPRNLREVQAYVDEINEIIKPIMEEIDEEHTGAGGYWYIQDNPLAVATWCFSKEYGFEIIGTEL